MTQAHDSPTMLACRALLALNGLVWIVLAVGSASMFLPRAEGLTILALVLALMFLNAGVFLGLAHRLAPTSTSVLAFAQLWVGLNLVLSFTDDVGLPDVLVGALNLVTLVLLATVWRSRGRAP